jgi:TatD DNase family protein
MNPLIDMNSHLSAYELSDVIEIMSHSQTLQPWRRFVLSGYDLEDWSKQKAFLSGYSPLSREAFTAIGYHPWKVAKNAENSGFSVSRELEAIEKQIAMDPAALSFIGEVGLDKTVASEACSMSLQARVFAKMLELASEHSKPLILHIISAHDLALKTLSEHSGLSGIVHAFSGSSEVALEYIRLGFKISVGPGVLNESFKKLRQALKEPALQGHLVFETDQPHSLETPEPYDYDLLSWIIAETAVLTGVPHEDLVDKACQSFLEMTGTES